MKEDFVRKKVESLTLGEKIRKLRGQYRMSLAEISKATKIQVKYLEYLENGEYGKLPAEVYVRGFLKGYARHLGLDEEALLKLYDKEKNIQANLGKEFTLDTRPRMPLTSSFVITSRTLTVGAIALIVSGTFLYLFQEFRSFVVEPALVILEPISGATIEGSVVTLKGKTDRGTQVTVNGQSVFVGSEGEFFENLILQQGINTILVTAKNRFEKEKTEQLTLEGRFETPAPDEVSDAQAKFTLVVTSQGEGATIGIEADGVIVYSGVLAPGEEQEVTARSEIKLSTDHGADTLISFRGGESAPLAETDVSLRDIVYTADGRRAP